DSLARNEDVEILAAAGRARTHDRYFFFFALVLRAGLTRSGSLAPPVSRFHSSNVSAEIFPLTSSSANFLRCAWLLNGMFRHHHFAGDPGEEAEDEPGEDAGD